MFLGAPNDHLWALRTWAAGTRSCRLGYDPPDFAPGDGELRSVNMYHNNGFSGGATKMGIILPIFSLWQLASINSATAAADPIIPAIASVPQPPDDFVPVRFDSCL